MKIIVICIFTLFLANPLWAGSIRINFGGTSESMTTTKYEPAIQRMADVYNTKQSANNPEFEELSSEQYVKRVIRSAFKSYVKQVRKRDATTACAAYEAKDGAGKQEVKDLLGGKSPCR